MRAEVTGCPFIIVPLSRSVRVVGGATAALVVRIPTRLERSVMTSLTEERGEDAAHAFCLLGLTTMAASDINALPLGDRRMIAAEIDEAMREPT